ncbi:hypothetical protein FRB99_007882 [Tulasnella sp. 403]|nr:hypothetical protein FRB99_007882 [Tulasnella sp. 403]
MYHWSAGVRSDSPLVSVTLPESHWPNHFHLFSLSLVPSDTHAVRPKISVRRVLPTTKWRIIDGIKAYALEVTLTNPLPSSNIAKSELWVKGPYTVSVGGDELKTVLPGVVDRIMPSDEVRVKVWVVETSPSVPAAAFGGRVKVKVSGETDRVTEVFGDFDLAKAFDPSPATRDTPEWWDDAKFGIFIHWGLYSVPGWAPKGWYAAWYWWWMHKWPNPDNGFWRYHKEHYGTDVVYDDFIEEFKPSQFNASEWIDIFGESGAKYFVLVTKHHDGFALFDTKDSTHRSSWHLGPKRDFIRELFDAAKAERPEMHRGTYISMPEWYNPDSGAGGYGFGDWPGQLAHNAFDYSKLEPYTGRVPGKDYLRDQQLAQMNMLAYDYDTEIMASPWCDIGGPNLTNEFAEGWYPYAESQGRQVVMNNRCGDIPQFDTPEYTRFSSIQTVKWETSEGIDPHCYAYNRATKPEEYKSARTVLHSLIDIVSKNGNYLIGLGPTADGIIVEPVVERMLDVGKWLKHSGDCVYGTKYFFPGAEHHDLRFTQTDSTFCIISFEKPQDGQLRVGRDVPVMNGDKISLLGGGKAGEDLKWHLEGGKLVVDVPDEAVELVELAWAFKVEYA